MPSRRIIPATLAFQNGIPYAEQFGDVYHSNDGGLAQACHVFLDGNHLPQRWQGRASFALLETGFGLGLNFLATWLAWRNDAQRCSRLHYVAIEKHPFSAADLAQLHAQWPELSELSAALCTQWPALTPGYHRLLLDEGKVVLTLIFGDIVDCLPRIDAACDAFYLDGFAPDKNPTMWLPDILIRLKRLAAPEATLATYTVSAVVRKALVEAGFACEKLPGFGRKRHMLAGRYTPRWQVLPRHAPRERRAIVIGAGIAGSAVCERLAARDWQITLIERHAAPAQEVSGNLAGIVMPMPSLDDNFASRLTRTAFLFALRHWQHLGGIGRTFDGAACGVLQLARDADEAQTQEKIAQEGINAELLRWLDSNAVQALAGIAASHGGWLMEHGGWVSPSSLCSALLAACGEHLQRRFSTSALTLEYCEDQWTVRDSHGGIIAVAPQLILANGCAATQFPQTASLPLTALRGQVTHMPASLLPPLQFVICGDGYITPPVQGQCTLGASFDKDADPQLRISSQQENLQRLTQLLPGLRMPEELPLNGRVGFRCAAYDRLPLAGALPDMNALIAGDRLRDVPRLTGLHCLLGLGSHGLTWAPLLAELIASHLEGEPAPIERELMEALDPARFALQAYRHGKSIPPL
jgi:tRNA 5-methylaminomethyl-2-thiouridine biosynthesis bifunctional protein